MKVALVVERFDPHAGGLEQWTVSLAAYLIDAGHDVDVVTFAAANHGLPVRLHLLEYARSMMERGRRIANQVALLGADVVHDTGTGWSGDVFQPQTGSRLLSLDREIASYRPLRRLRAALSPRMRWRRRQMAKLERMQAARARHVIAVSQRSRRELAARHGLPLERISVIANGVDTRRFEPGRIAELRGPMRQQLGVGGATLFIAGAYNLRLKGIDTAIRALAMLTRSGADVRLAVAGGRPDAFWTGLADQLGIADRLHFLGPVTPMEPLFAAADACIHPTRWDACSLTTIEAMACALPVVTTAINGASELIDHGSTGFVLPNPEDATVLAETMRTLLDPALRARIGAAAREAALGYDIVRNCRAVETVLAEAARCAQ